MAVLTISVPDDLRDFVDRRAKETQHPSSAEYIQSLIRLDQERAEHERLEHQLLEGLDSGEPTTVNHLDDHFSAKKQALLDRFNKAHRP